MYRRDFFHFCHKCGCIGLNKNKSTKECHKPFFASFFALRNMREKRADAISTEFSAERQKNGEQKMRRQKKPTRWLLWKSSLSHAIVQRHWHKWYKWNKKHSDHYYPCDLVEYILRIYSIRGAIHILFYIAPLTLYIYRQIRWQSTRERESARRVILVSSNILAEFISCTHNKS